MLLKKYMRITARALLLVAGVLLIHLNLGLFYVPAYDEGGADKGLLGSLRHLREALRDSAGERMQAFYPEGYFFMQAMYGLSWCDVAEGRPLDDPLYREAMTAIAAADSALDTDKGRAVFTKELPIPYGAFYNGWRTYLLGRRIALQKGAADSLDRLRFENNCFDIATQLVAGQSTYPESYPGQSWPSDAAVCAACLSLYDRVLDTSLYTGIIGNWMKQVKAKLDPRGMVPHSVTWPDNAVKEGARGSSTSLMLCFWDEIDTAFARQQFTLYKKYFLTSRFGLPGIREYPQGLTGNGDVDSGPVLLGVGGSASVVGLRVMTLYGESDIAVGLRNSIETFGCSHFDGKHKRYLFGVLPVADAFIAWANAAACTEHNAPVAKGFWKMDFELYTLPLAVLCMWGAWRMRKRKIRS
jgi:hypothetical protein